MNEVGFLDFYIAALITGSILGMDRELLKKAAVRFLPVSFLSMAVAALMAGIVGILTGQGFRETVLYIAMPMMSGGMGAGVVPLSNIYADALGLDKAQIISRMIPASTIGNVLDYICRTRKALGTMPEHPVAVTTIVSTDMATPVAAKYGVELRRTLTGFKFIGEQIGLLEAAGEADRYIFGFEESYGYLSGAHVRDKDAVNATLLVCEAAAWYAKQGMTLLDAINKLYAEFGCYRNALHSFAFEGESGMHTMQAIMKQLRETPPQSIGGLAVESVLDYNTEGTGLPKANVLEFRLAGGAKLMVRPSGTEPKIKVYLSAVAPTEEAADAINETLGKAAADLLKA